MDNRRNGRDRRISEHIYTYQDGNTIALVFMDVKHQTYRIEVREDGVTKAIFTSEDRRKAIKEARTAVLYVNKRGK